MNGSQTQTHHLHWYLPETVAGGSMTEGVGDFCVIVLAILGLIGVFSSAVAAIATIIVGAVFLADSVMVSAAARALSEHASSRIGSGMSACFYAGIAGIVLGILSFFHTAPAQLLSVAVLVFGSSLFLSGGTLSHLKVLLNHPQGTSMPISSGGTFIGLGVTILGILAVSGLAPLTLSLVGLLCLGIAALFSSAPYETAHETA